MAQPAQQAFKAPRTESAESFDFDETSDFCDFGFVLVSAGEGAERPAPPD